MSGEVAFMGEGLSVGGFLMLRNARVEGGVLLKSVRTENSLNLSGIHISRPGKVALDLDHAQIGGELVVEPGRISGDAKVRGGVRLANARVASGVSIWQLSIDVGDSERRLRALFLEGSDIGANLNIRRSTITGSIGMRDARIARSINFDGTHVTNEARNALDLERAKVGGDVFIRADLAEDRERRDARFVGSLVFAAMSVDGSVIVADNALENGDARVLMNRMKVAGTLRLQDISFGKGMVSLANARVAFFSDPRTTWPPAGSLLLDGFEFSSFTGNAAFDWKSRLDWLERSQPEAFNPQPYTNLSSALKRAGHDFDSRMVSIGRNRRARSYMQPLSPRWVANWLMEVTCGHGYRPWLAILWGAAFILIGAVVFDLNDDERIQLKPITSVAVPESARRYPTYRALIYSADTFLPIVNLQQKDNWVPNENLGKGSRAKLYLPFHILAGWFFTTLFVGGVTGLIRRE